MCLMQDVILGMEKVMWKTPRGFVCNPIGINSVLWTRIALDHLSANKTSMVMEVGEMFVGRIVHFGENKGCFDYSFKKRLEKPSPNRILLEE